MNVVLNVFCFAQYAPSSSPFTPMYVAAKNPPKPYMHGSLFNFDASVSFWNFCVIGNYMSHMYKYVVTDVKAAQVTFETTSSEDVSKVEEKVLAMLNSGESNSKIIDTLDKFTSEHGENAVSTWKDLFPKLITKYHDGYTALNLTAPTITMHRNGYPQWCVAAALHLFSVHIFCVHECLNLFILIMSVVGGWKL